MLFFFFFFFLFLTGASEKEKKEFLRQGPFLGGPSARRDTFFSPLSNTEGGIETQINGRVSNIPGAEASSPEFHWQQNQRRRRRNRAAWSAFTRRCTLPIGRRATGKWKENLPLICSPSRASWRNGLVFSSGGEGRWGDPPSEARPASEDGSSAFFPQSRRAERASVSSRLKRNTRARRQAAAAGLAASRTHSGPVGAAFTTRTENGGVHFMNR